MISYEIENLYQYMNKIQNQGQSKTIILSQCVVAFRQAISLSFHSTILSEANWLLQLHNYFTDTRAILILFNFVQEMELQNVNDSSKQRLQGLNCASGISSFFGDRGALYLWWNSSGWNVAAALNHTTWTHTGSHIQDLCEPPVHHHCSQAAVEVLWSESYNIPPNSSSQPLPSHVLLAFSLSLSLLPPSDKSCTSRSLSPMSGAFSMALNTVPPYFIEHFVGWCPDSSTMPGDGFIH